jgi:2-polyprenyl-6-methoxyphenol hydroxylase-like FAD-dependent oxidoreductase
MTHPPILIAGGGIAGLALGLTLHQIGLPFRIFEAAREMKPLGVGINLQPNAVREIFDLGLDAAQLARIGVSIREWALAGRNGLEFHAEPRGLAAGYGWPQFAVHRGQFQMLLYQTLIERAGADCIVTGQRVTDYRSEAGGVSLGLQGTDDQSHRVQGALLIGADGIHSRVRAQMHPDQPPIHWGGALMWRGTTRTRPLRGGASFLGLGGARQRMVIYPISTPDADGLCLVNWIAEITVDDPAARDASGWFQRSTPEAALAHFTEWRTDWLDVSALICGAEEVYENPMIDRDPAPFWAEGPVALIGDAAHAMYPTGSNGASQAIVDARVLGTKLLAHGMTPAALGAYDAQLCAPISALVLRNRGAGPFGLLDLIEARATQAGLDPQRIDSATLDSLVPPPEREAFMASYKAAAGFAIETLNAAPPLIAQDARHRP